MENKKRKNRDGLENSDDWETPESLYKALDDEFHFDFDPCPLKHDFDGLTVEWAKSNFVNPPYNRDDKPRFIQKAFDEWRKGKTCVLLIPSATGTKQFHDLILPNAEVRFLRGRVAFRGYNSKGIYVTSNKGKHDSMVVVFRAVDGRPVEFCRCACGTNAYRFQLGNGKVICSHCGGRRNELPNSADACA